MILNDTCLDLLYDTCLDLDPSLVCINVRDLMDFVTNMSNMWQPVFCLVNDDAYIFEFAALCYAVPLV